MNFESDGTTTRASALRKEAISAELSAALSAVADPATYLHTFDGDHPRARAAAAERAKAMTGLYLFEVEGLIRAAVRGRDKGICDVPSVVHNAWLRWLQLHGRQAAFAVPMDGWLVEAFPKKLLTKDEEVLDLLTSSVQLGCTRRGVPLDIPSALLVPAKLTAAAWEIPRLPRAVQGLISTGSISAVSPYWRAPLSVGSAKLLIKLETAFAQAVSSPRHISVAEFPGH